MLYYSLIFIAKQQNLVPILVDYYINFDCNKQLIELLCKIPDDLVNVSDNY